METKLDTIEVMVGIAILFVATFLIVLTLSYPVFGLFPFGPEETIVAKVERLYVDSRSYYMVGTYQGVFEVNNSTWLWMWDANERYANIKEGGTYKFRVKGRKMLNILFQEYPGIISVTPMEGKP